MTPQAALVDFRSEDFETMEQFQDLVVDARDHYLTEHNGTLIEIVISEDQHKRLKFDAHLNGFSAQWLRTNGLKKVCSVPIIATKFEEGCPGCGSDLH